MPKGRRKPIEQHVLDGTYRADRHGPLTAADLPEPPPDAPDGLTPDESGAWGRVVPLLAGVVKRRDLPVLVDLVRWVVRGDRIAARVGQMPADDPKFMQAITVAAISTDKLLALSARFGMTPADRAKLRVTDAGPPKAKVRTRPATKLDKQGGPK